MAGAKGAASGAQRYPRVARVNEVLREVVADAIERLADAHDEFGLVTVTGVECATDLRTAVVYVSSLTDEQREVLDERRAQLQHEVATQVRMKRTPRLRFAVDPAVVQGSIVEDALRRLGRTTP